MKTIVCDINLFDMMQTIYLKDSETNKVEQLGQSKLSNLDTLIVRQCYSLDVRQVHLFGPEEIAQDLNCKIQNTEDLCYECTKIKIEVN